MDGVSQREAKYDSDNSGGVGLLAKHEQKKSVKLQKLGPNQNEKMQMAQKIDVQQDRESKEL